MQSSTREKPAGSGQTRRLVQLTDPFGVQLGTLEQRDDHIRAVHQHSVLPGHGVGVHLLCQIQFPTLVFAQFEIIKRIIEAGMKAPSWDHYRNWQFIVLHTKEEKEKAFSYAKFIADRFDLSKYEGRKLNLAQEMYAYAILH